MLNVGGLRTGCPAQYNFVSNVTLRFFRQTVPYLPSFSASASSIILYNSSDLDIGSGSLNSRLRNQYGLISHKKFVTDHGEILYRELALKDRNFRVVLFQHIVSQGKKLVWQ